VNAAPPDDPVGASATRPPSTPGPQPDEIVRRLRAWPVSGWRHGDRVARARRSLQDLADLGAHARGLAVAPQVPQLGPHALGDQLAVLVSDAWRAGVGAADVNRVVSELARHLRMVR
jgi:hypothetical protein